MKANWQRLSERVEYEEQFNALDEKLFAGFTTRNGGVSEFPYKTLNMGFHVGDTVDAVVQNRERVAKDVGFSLDHWVGSEQVHASVIQEVTKSDRGRGARSLRTAINETDGLYTRETDILLTSCMLIVSRFIFIHLRIRSLVYATPVGKVRSIKLDPKWSVNG